jgi:GNAT superfamily N-acetyltransferase
MSDSGHTSVREIGPGDSGLVFRAMHELRTHLDSREEFERLVDQVQRPQGYRLAGSFDAGAEEAVAVAGFRLTDSLSWGRHIYVDDLVTREAHRGRGHGDALMRWLMEEAVRLGCSQLHLDSGVQRFDAHRFYLAHGMAITAHHFAIEVPG